MKKLILGLVITLTLLTFTPMFAQRASLPLFKTCVLLVGVSDYQYHKDLVNPIIDVKAIETELREIYQCETKMLLNPTRHQFQGALRQLAQRQYDQYDQLLVFFAGHGWFDDLTKRGYLALSDSQEVKNDPFYDSYVSHEDVSAILERLDCNHVLLIVDSCFSGTLDPTIALAHRGIADAGEHLPVSHAKYIKRKLKYKTRRYITAGGKEYVSDGRPGHHSPFTRRLLEALRTFGGSDGLLRLEEMMIEIERAKPKPRMGELFGNEPGSSFILIASPENNPERKTEYGELFVITTPENAQVTVEPLDELQWNTGPQPRRNHIRLPLGFYRIHATLAGYKPATQNVYVGEEGRTIKLTLDIITEFISSDGAGMVLIPAGGFQMGTASAEIPQLVKSYKKYSPAIKTSWFEDEAPLHTVYLEAFYIDKYEVTNEQYANFLNKQGKNIDADGNKLIDLESPYCLIEKRGNFYRPKPGYGNHPVIEVSWYGAVAYAQFYGKRLPSEAEWEKAARGGLSGRKYPWGDSKADDNDANFADKNTDYSWSDRRVNDRYELTAPAGSYAPNRYGLYDMAGNVWEWCSDWYSREYYDSSPKSQPQGPGKGGFRVCRSGSWLSGTYIMRCASRNRLYPSFSVDDLGFRCCMSFPVSFDNNG